MDSDLFDPEEFEASAASQNTIDDYSLHGAAQYDELKQGAKMVRDVISGDFNSGAGKQTETGVSSLIINRPPVVATVVKLLASETALSLPQTPKVRADENGRSPKRRKLHRDTSSDSRRKVDEKDGVDSGDEKIGHEPRPTSQSTLRSALPIDAPKPKPSKRNPLYPSWPNENCHTGAGTQEFIKGGIRLRKGFSFKRVSFDKSCSPPTFVNVKKWLIPTEGKLPAPKVIENTEAHTSATLDIFPMTPSSLFEYLQQLYDSPTLQCAPCKSLYDCIPSWQPQSQPSSDFLDTGSTTSFFPNPGSGSDPTVTLAMWLDEWKTAKGCDRDSREQSKQRSIKRHRSDSTGRDFASSDEEYYDSDSDGGGQPTSPEHLMLIGPPGVGKTSLVYAIAGEKDFDIIEINAGQRRNGKDILIAVGEAVNNQNIEQLGKVAEGINIQRMFAAISDAPPPTSKRKGKDAAAKGAGAKRTGRTKARATGKSRKRKSRQQAGAVENSGRNLRSFFTPKNCEGAETESEEPVSLESASEDVDIDVEGLGDTSRGLPPAIDAASDLPSPPSTKGTLRKRLVLLDEVDALCEADRGFWGSVLTLLHKSKCPIIFTCNSNPLTPSNQMIPNGILSGLVNLIRLVQIQWPSTKQVACYLHLKCLASGYWLTDTKPLALIAQAYRGDVRKCLTHLALYTRSLSGEEGKPDAASAESTSETLRGFKVISLGVPFIGGCHRNTVGQLASLPLPQTNGISRMPTKAHLPAGALLELLTPYIKEADALALYDILANSRVKSFNGLLHAEPEVTGQTQDTDADAFFGSCPIITSWPSGNSWQDAEGIDSYADFFAHSKPLDERRSLSAFESPYLVHEPSLAYRRPIHAILQRALSHSSATWRTRTLVTETGPWLAMMARLDLARLPADTNAFAAYGSATARRSRRNADQTRRWFTDMLSEEDTVILAGSYFFSAFRERMLSSQRPPKEPSPPPKSCTGDTHSDVNIRRSRCT